MTHTKLQAASSQMGFAAWVLRYAGFSGIMFAATAILAWWQEAWPVALTAGVICWAGASLGFWILCWGSTPQRAAVALGGAILVRTLLPLVVALVVQHKFPWLQAQGFLGQVVVIYLVGLAVETVLVVPVFQKQQVVPAGPVTTRSEHG